MFENQTMWGSGKKQQSISGILGTPCHCVAMEIATKAWKGGGPDVDIERLENTGERSLG